MKPIPQPVAPGIAPDKRLAPVFGPQGGVVELARVPADLEEHARDPHGVAGGASSGVVLELGIGRVGPRDVAAMVGRVEVDPVPAGGEEDVCQDAGRAGVLGEACRAVGVLFFFSLYQIWPERGEESG